MHVQAACLTDAGEKRDGNEDAFFVDAARQLYVVTDGMGGHPAGDVASGTQLWLTLPMNAAARIIVPWLL